MHYNPWVDTRLVAKFNVTDTSNPTKIGYKKYISGFTKIEIDGVEQPNVVSAYTFDTTGEHTIKYTLADETKVDSSAFNGCDKLISVIIPNTVTTISMYAFNSCSSLSSITIPDSVLTISAWAFANDTSLTSITIPSSVTIVGNSVFNNCPNLSSIIVDSNNLTYDSRDNCNAIINTSTNALVAACKNTVIPNTITTIQHYAFDGCNTITSITIPNSVATINDGAFRGCSGLTSIIIGSGVANINNGIFQDCINLQSITSLATTAPTIKSSTFSGISQNGTLYVPQGSTGYDTWMGTGNYYLGLYNWTLVEQ